MAVHFGLQPASGLFARRLLKPRVPTVSEPTYQERRGRLARSRELAQHKRNRQAV